MSARTAEVVVIGAGLAGLAAARQLSIHGIDVHVLEADSRVGGRIKTDEVDGYLLDHGFQLYNPAYPEASRVLDNEALNLAPLTRGIEVALEDGHTRLGDPRSNPRWLPHDISLATGSPIAKARFARYAWGTTSHTAAELEQRIDMPASAALRGSGVDDRLFERVLQPFLAGVFLESELRTSRHFLDLVLRSFLRGTPSIPTHGMRALPEQLHDALPEDCVHLDERVTEIRGTSVHTEAGSWEAQALIVATDASAASRFLPGMPDATWNGVATWYFSTSDGAAITHGLPTLAVDGAHRGPILNAVAMSHASPTYAPAGKTLVAASTLELTSDAEFEHEMRTHLATILGVSTSDWELVGRYEIGHALPAMVPPFSVRKPVEVSPGLYVAGDHRDTSSIQGAMVSGRRAADAALRFLGHTVIT